MTQEAPRCQMVVRDTLQLAVGGMQIDAARERACGLPLVPTEGPCVTCGREERAVCSYYADCYTPVHEWIGKPAGPHGHHPYVSPLGCSIHDAATDGGREA